MITRRRTILYSLAISAILGGRPTLAAPSRAMRLLDTDNDATLSKDEYMRVVESRFRAADPDNDGTLDEKELGSRAGRSLLRLMQ